MTTTTTTTTTTGFQHIPVLLGPVLDLLADTPGTRFVDATLGGGGHSQALLDRRPDIRLLGLDRDPAAIAAASERLRPYADRLTAVQATFSSLEQVVHDHGWSQIDALLMDIGVSSPQLDLPERGFSFRFDGPLDMRMHPSHGPTAADLLNTLPERELADILYRYGEERRSRQVAAEIVRRRRERPWTRTGELAELLERVVGRAHQHGLPPATRCFQALRIAVNDELGELERTLRQAVRLVAVGGRIAVITFHSLEDRIVKQFFREQAATCTCPPGLPVCVCGKVSTLRILTPKPVTASEQELQDNPRAACAKLRAATVIHNL